MTTKQRTTEQVEDEKMNVDPHTRQAVEGAIGLAKEHGVPWGALIAKQGSGVPRWREGDKTEP